GALARACDSACARRRTVRLSCAEGSGQRGARGARWARCRLRGGCGLRRSADAGDRGGCGCDPPDRQCPARLMMTLTPGDLTGLKQQPQKITMITAYDAPSARFADAAGIDAILVGDSAAMTVFGYDETTAITLDDMLVLARAARRGTTRALLIAD